MLKKYMGVFFIVYLLSCRLFASINVYNPAVVYNQLVISIKEEKWQVAAKFFSNRKLYTVKEFFNKWKNSPDELKAFLKREGVKNPKKIFFSDYMSFFAYVLKESSQYREFFKNISKPFWKVRIDYYHIGDKFLYKDELHKLQYIDYSLVRKLQFFNDNIRFYIRKDVKGWYISL